MSSSFILAAVLTPSADPWNQLVFAAPMFGPYLVGIVIAWIAAPTRREETAVIGKDANPALVFAAAVFEQARKSRAARSRST